MTASEELHVGFGIREITPPLGTPFGGFAIERTQGASGVYDPLYATAIVVSGAGGTVVLVSCDLQLISPQIVACALAEIEARIGVVPAAVMVHATHVHSAPGGDAAEATIPGLDGYFSTPQVEQIVISGIAAAVTDGWQDRRPGSLAAVSGRIAGIGDSRHRKLIGPQFAALARFIRAGADPLTIANHGCHASVLGPDNTLVSADFPGVLRRRAGERNERLFFINAPAGDISTRATRREQTFSEVERLGTALDGQLLTLEAGVVALSGNKIAWLRSCVSVPARAFDVAGLADAAEKAEERCANADGADLAAAEQAARRARFRLGRLSRFDGASIEIELQVFRIAGMAVLGVGGELFSELGARIEAKSPFPVTLIAAPVNGSVGNIPTTELAAEVGAMVTGAAGPAVVREAVNLLHRLWKMN